VTRAPYPEPEPEVLTRDEIAVCIELIYGFLGQVRQIWGHSDLSTETAEQYVQLSRKLERMAATAPE
jgi:hypothetical protein